MPIRTNGEHVRQNNLEEGWDLRDLEKTLGYKFKNLDLLRQALTHPSCDGMVSYERLEFLGDAVVELIVSKLLFEAYPDEKEGQLTRKRAVIVCTAGLADLAQSLHLGDYLVIGNAEVKSQGRRKLTILENTMEAVLGAIYEDGGYEQVYRVASKLFEDRVRGVGDGVRIEDYKSIFQQLVQARGKERIQYVTVDREGPPHQPTFYVELTLDDEPISGGRGSSKKQAEQRAAQYAVEHFTQIYQDGTTPDIQALLRRAASDREAENAKRASVSKDAAARGESVQDDRTSQTAIGPEEQASVSCDAISVAPTQSVELLGDDEEPLEDTMVFDPNEDDLDV